MHNYYKSYMKNDYFFKDKQRGNFKFIKLLNKQEIRCEKRENSSNAN